MAIAPRVERALSQRMYLINHREVENRNNNANTPAVYEEYPDVRGRIFTVLGSTGNVYDVRIDRLPTCTCPDFVKGNLWKHIIFVVVKVRMALWLYDDVLAEVFCYNLNTIVTYRYCKFHARLR